MARARIQRELLDLQKNPSTQFSAEPVNDDLFHWGAILIGPPGTPYENGVFPPFHFISIRLPIQTTKGWIYHKNLPPMH